MSDLPLDEYLRNVFSFVTGAVVSAGVWIGDRLGLYRALAGAGPVSAGELAARTGLSERFLLEWVRSQAAAGVLAYRGDDRYELTEAGAMVLADEHGSLAFAAGAFEMVRAQFGVLDQLLESFRTGVGVAFDAFGAEGSRGVERMFAPWYRHMLVPVVLRSLDGLAAKLERGARVAEIGCGAGVALVTMASAYPASEFHGYDISRHAVERASVNVGEAGVRNVTVHDASASTLPADASFDFVCAFDCVHDMTDPQSAIDAARQALRDDGTMLIADIKSYASFDENVERNPMAALVYGSSLLACLPSSTSVAGGAGLGALGFHEELAREMASRAGFTQFATHDFGHPVNRYYEIRP